MTVNDRKKKARPFRGIPVVISAPSGAGKSTISSLLLKLNPTAVVSISCTTRLPRAGEKDGKDYFFTTPDDFKKKIEAGQFLEWAKVHGHYYGTPLSYLESQLDDNKDVVLTIDPQGALSVKRIYPKGIFIFVVPPSWDILVKRLTKRGTEDSSSVKIRLANARKELSYLSHYDYLIINDDLENAVQQTSSILQAEHLRLERIDTNNIAIFSKDF